MKKNIVTVLLMTVLLLNNASLNAEFGLFKINTDWFNELGKNKFTLCLAAGTGILGLTLYKYLMQPTLKINELREEQKQKLETLLETISKDSITSIYNWTGKPLLLTLEEEVGLEELRTLLKNNNIFTVDLIGNICILDDEIYKRLCARTNLVKKLKQSRQSTDPEEKQRLKAEILQSEPQLLISDTASIKELTPMLEDAKTVLKAFVPDKDITKKYFKVKTGINRLLTYIKLYQVIKEKNLQHIHLPIKFLIIKDNDTQKNIVGEQAIRLLNDLIKISTSMMKTTIQVLVTSEDRYSVQIFAQEYSKCNTPMTQETRKEIEELIKEAPFDIGYDNIFSTENGDAVIIDTEFKGESAESSLGKIDRYKFETQ